MGQFLDSVREVKKNYKPYDNWEQAQADEKAKKIYLSKTLDVPKDKVELTTAKAKTVIRAAELLDKRSEDNCEDMELFTGILMQILILPLAMVPVLFMNKCKTLKSQMVLNAASLIGTFAAMSGLVLWSNHKQKEASRIGRFQAKENELKDVKNFVIYTPEQIENAVKKADEVPNEKEKKNLSRIYSNIKNTFKDKPAYLASLEEKNDNEIDKLKAGKYTAEQLKQGAEDKELIVDTVKEINIRAEEYSENCENAYETMGMLSFLAAAPIGMLLNKGLQTVFKKLNPAASGAISQAVSFMVALSIFFQGTVEQKTAARVGRFKTRQDLMKNPAALMHYTDEQIDKAKDVKAEKQKKSVLEKISNSFAFLKQYGKDKKEYMKYKEEELLKNEKLIKVLREETPVSEKQMKDAKHLQEKVFLAFDEIDEMSQRYSEDVEAGTEIAKEAFGTVFGLLWAGGLSWLTLSAVSGKLPVDKIVKKLSSMTLDKNSKIRKLIEEGYDLMKNDKGLRKSFNEHALWGEFGEIAGNKKLKEIGTKLNAEFGSIMIKGGDKKGLTEALEPHFKKGFFAKWGRNFTLQALKLKLKNTFSKTGLQLSPEMENWLKPNYKNYATLWNTGAALVLPGLAALIAIPYSFNAWLTNIQKKAGKIGIMKAMERIDDEKVFVNKDTETAVPVVIQNNGNLLNKFKAV